MMRAIGFDLSLTSAGVSDGHASWKIKPKRKGVERLSEIRGEVTRSLMAVRPVVAVIEGYSFGSKGRAVFNIGEAGGVVRLLLHDLCVPFAEVPPTTLKLFATGKGNSDKDAMIEAAIRRFGFEGHGNDEADAWLLVKMLETAYGDGGTNDAQRRAIASVDWPDLDAKGE